MRVLHSQQTTQRERDGDRVREGLWREGDGLRRSKRERERKTEGVDFVKEREKEGLWG